MPITFRCDHCHQLMRISRRKAGQETICPRCQQTTIVPELEVPEAEDDISLKEGAAESDLESPEIKSVARREDASGKNASFRDEEEIEETEFELRRPQTEFEELDLTPMVDVTFLLLIFFMVTASFSLEKSFEVPPPEPDQEGASRTVQPLEELEEQSILVEVDAEDRFYVETEEITDPRNLPTRLAEIRTEESKNEVIIMVDEASSHESMVSVIDAAQEIGLQRIRWGVKSAED